MRTMTPAKAQNHFGELLDAAQREAGNDYQARTAGGLFGLSAGFGGTHGNTQSAIKSCGSIRGFFAAADNKLSPEA
jgi:hypothetical protein